MSTILSIWSVYFGLTVLICTIAVAASECEESALLAKIYLIFLLSSIGLSFLFYPLFGVSAHPMPQAVSYKSSIDEVIGLSVMFFAATCISSYGAYCAISSLFPKKRLKKT